MKPLPRERLRRELEKRYPDSNPDAIEAAMVRGEGFLGQAIALMEGNDLSPQAIALVEALSRRDQVALLQALVSMEKCKRDAFVEILQQVAAVMQQALVCRSGGGTTSPQAQKLSGGYSAAQLLQSIKILQKSIHYAQGNISTAAISGYLQWALR